MDLQALGVKSIEELVEVLVLYNEPVLPADHPDAESEKEIVETAGEVAKILRQVGYHVVEMGVGRDPTPLWKKLQEDRPDVVFNLFEGLADHPSTETTVTGLLEWHKVPFTGSPSLTLGLANQKHLTKRLLAQAPLPTPPFFVIENEREPIPTNSLGWPVIVKPAGQDASVGIEQGSVVLTQNALEDRIRYILRTYGPPVMVESFVFGRELSLSVLEREGELVPLPFYEIHFEGQQLGLWPIYDYKAKWEVGSPEQESAPISFGIEVDPALQNRLHDLAFRAFRLLGCRDYARVDFRVDLGGRPFLLEVNPNPDICPEAGLVICLEEMGCGYDDFLIGLVNNALARGKRNPRDRRLQRGA